MRKMSIAQMVLAAALLTTLAFCRGTCSKSEAATPTFSGRFTQDPEHPDAKLFAWSQSTIRARFVGTRLQVRMQDVLPAAQGDGPNHFNVTIDDRPPFVLALRDGVSEYPLVQGLPEGEHTVTLTKRTEALVGTVRFFGFDTGEGGRLIAAPPLAERRLLIIGDSISAGYGNEGPDEKCHFTPATENSDLAYGPTAARALGAQVHIVAWSGKGVYQNRDQTRDNLMPQLLQRTLPANANSLWDPNDYIPDAVVINLGTNDFGHDVAPEQPFEDAYYKLVTDLRAIYPRAYVLMALGPMLADSENNHQQLSAARRMLQVVVARLNAAQVRQVGFLEFPMQNGELGFGCDWHPSRATHARMGAQLAASLQATLGWK